MEASSTFDVTIFQKCFQYFELLRVVKMNALSFRNLKF